MFGESIGKTVIAAFEFLTPDLKDIYSSTRGYALSDWRLLQQSLVTGTGVTSVAIPVLHLAAMGADIAFLMNRMSVCSYGIGAILGSEHGKGNILETEDFAVILGRWSGDDSLSDASIAKAAAGAAGHIGGPALTSLLAKVAAEKAGILLGKKLGGKLGAKIGSKFAAKLGTKAVGGFLPFVGPAIGGGVNLWFITSIASEAEKWYRLKLLLGGEASGEVVPAPAA